jgi:hypothetical protein
MDTAAVMAAKLAVDSRIPHPTIVKVFAAHIILLL